MDDSQLADYSLQQGGVYNLLVARDPETNKVAAQLYTLTSPNSIHICGSFPSTSSSPPARSCSLVTGKRIVKDQNT